MKFIQSNAFLPVISVCLPLLCSLAEMSAADPQPADVKSLAWMVGAWTGRLGEVETEEHWIAPKGRIMLGVARMTRGDKPASFEFLRIAQTAAGLSYFASPGGRPAIEFSLVEQGPQRVAFENPKHDFPQRISYWLDAEGALHARIEGMIKDQQLSHEFRWERVR
jgi:hypothetical protein